MTIKDLFDKVDISGLVQVGKLVLIAYGVAQALAILVAIGLLIYFIKTGFFK